MNIAFHRYEERKITERLGPPQEQQEKVICSFNTNRLGILQVVAENTVENKSSIETVDLSVHSTPHEPDMNMLTEKEQQYIEKYMSAVFFIVFYPAQLFEQ